MLPLGGHQICRRTPLLVCALPGARSVDRAVTLWRRAAGPAALTALVAAALTPPMPVAAELIVPAAAAPASSAAHSNAGRWPFLSVLGAQMRCDSRWHIIWDMRRPPLFAALF